MSPLACVDESENSQCAGSADAPLDGLFAFSNAPASPSTVAAPTTQMASAMSVQQPTSSSAGQPTAPAVPASAAG